jgi:class 3 adenylate cyclase
MGDDASDSGTRGAGGSSRTSSVVSFSQLCGSRSLGARGQGSADDDTHSAHSGLSRQTGSVSMGSDANASVSSMDNLGRQDSDAETFAEARGSDVASGFERRSRKTGGSRAKSARVSFDAPPPLHVPPSARVMSAAQTVDRDVIGQLRSSASRGASGKRSSSGVRARDHADVTVIFVDIVGFSDMCKRTRPIGVLRFLEHYFESLDKVAEEHGVTKVRTVGDGYLAVSGLMADMGVAQDAHRHVLRAMTFGLGVIQEIKDTGMLLADGQPLVVRVGMAHGPVFSGVVGRTCMQYDIFGDTPNLAARMEQTCPHDAVHMPAESFEKMKADLGEALASEFEALRFETHARVEIKNMGRVDTVSLAFRGNEESIERVLAGAIGDDDNRAVAAHIGVMADQLRNAKWGSEENRTRRESHESHDASSEEGEGSEKDARYGGVSSELEDEASRRAEGEVSTTSRATSARLSSERLVGISKDARPGASADVVVDVREGAPADGNE